VAVRVLDLLAEDEGHLEEEEVALAALADQRLGVPHLEGLLQDQLALGVDVPVEACGHTHTGTHTHTHTHRRTRTHTHINVHPIHTH